MKIHEDDFGLLAQALNFPPGNIGIGKTTYRLPDGRVIGVINLHGRTFFHDTLDCPFRTGETAIEELSQHTKTILIDFHAEATSEKLAFAHFVDGKASAVVGTHTHVQTADERILPGGTAFISDAGMTGPEYSVIGMKKDAVIRKFLLQVHNRFEPSEQGPMLNAVKVVIDDATGKAVSIARIFERVTLTQQ